MADTDTGTLVYKHYSPETASNFTTILIISFLNAFASIFTKIETEMLLVGFPYGFNKIFMASNEYYLMVYCPFHCTTHAIHWLLSRIYGL